MATLTEVRLERLRYLRDLKRQQAEVKHDVTRYYDDPLGFADDCIDWRGEGLTAYQRDDHRLAVGEAALAVRGPHGLGKSTHSRGRAAVVRADLRCGRVDWKAVTTAGSLASAHELPLARDPQVGGPGPLGQGTRHPVQAAPSC